MKIRNPIKPVIVTEKTYWPHIAAIAALWALAMTMGYYDEAQADAMMTEQMADCLNGKWRGVTMDGDQIGCFPAEVLKKNEVTK